MKKICSNKNNPNDHFKAIKIDKKTLDAHLSSPVGSPSSTRNQKYFFGHHQDPEAMCSKHPGSKHPWKDCFCYPANMKKPQNPSHEKQGKQNKKQKKWKPRLIRPMLPVLQCLEIRRHLTGLCHLTSETCIVINDETVTLVDIEKVLTNIKAFDLLNTNISTYTATCEILS